MVFDVIDFSKFTTIYKGFFYFNKTKHFLHLNITFVLVQEGQNGLLHKTRNSILKLKSFTAPTSCPGWTKSRYDVRA